MRFQLPFRRTFQQWSAALFSGRALAAKPIKTGGGKTDPLPMVSWCATLMGRRVEVQARTKSEARAELKRWWATWPFPSRMPKRLPAGVAVERV